MASVEYPNGQVINFDYEDKGGDFRLKEIENLGDGGTALSKFGYATDAMGRIRQWQQQEGTEATQRYDIGYNAVDEVVSAVLKNDSSNAIVKEFYYGFDLGGNRTSEQVDGVVRSSSYNNLNQLTGSTAGGKTRFRGTINEPGTVKVNGQSAWMTSGTNFQTDATLTSGTNTVTVEAKDASNNVRTNTYQVVVPGGATRTVTYDANGNMLNDGERTYGWDASNRLVKITYPDTSSTEFTYDAFGRRARIVEKDALGVSQSSKRFIWEDLTIAEERDDANEVVKSFYGQGMQYGGRDYFYTRDHLGSVRELTDESSHVQSAYNYDPYGKQDTSLPSGMKLWLKADAGVTKDGSNKVSAWADQSGNGSNAAQATASAQPTWVSGAVNGEPVVRFGVGGADDYLSGTVAMNVSSDDFTVFSIHQRSSATLHSAPFSFSASSGDFGAPQLSWMATNSGTVLLDTIGTTDSGRGWGKAKYVDVSGEPNAYHLSSLSRKGGSGGGEGGTLTIRSQADEELSENKSIQDWSGTHAGGYLVGSHNWGLTLSLVGDVAEVIVYDRHLSPSERSRVEAYLGKKYDRNVVQSDFRYTGHYFHEKSGLSLAPYRAYNADLGRWISRDPIGETGPDGPNLYAYVANNPINAFDPYGLTAAFIAGGLANPQLLAMLQDEGMDFGATPEETLDEAVEAVKCVAAGAAIIAATLLIDRLTAGIAGKYLPHALNRGSLLVGSSTKWGAAKEVSLFSKAITGRGPVGVAEQMTMRSAMAGNGTVIMKGPFGDPLYQGANWVKMQVVGRGTDANITVHYMFNTVTKESSQFKFVTKPVGHP